MTENGRKAKKRQVNARVSDETYAQLRLLAGKSYWGTQTTVLAIAIDRLYRDCMYGPTGLSGPMTSTGRPGPTGVTRAVPDKVALA